MTRQRKEEVGEPHVIFGRLKAVVMSPGPTTFAPYVEVLDRNDSTRLIYLDDRSTNVNQYQQAIGQIVIVTVELQVTDTAAPGALLPTTPWALDWWEPFVLNNLKTAGRPGLLKDDGLSTYVKRAGDPIPMRLCCEKCGELHIDEGEFATKPHHTHSCQHCGLTWRPALVPTVGVRFLPGFKNEAK